VRRTSTQCNEEWQQNNARKSRSTQRKQHQCEGCYEEKQQHARRRTPMQRVQDWAPLWTTMPTWVITTLTRVAVLMQEKIQREKTNQKNKTKHSQQKKNITTRQKTSLWRKMNFRLHFIQLPLSLTLNNTSASLGSGCCLRTLNWKIENWMKVLFVQFLKKLKNKN